MARVLEFVERKRDFILPGSVYGDEVLIRKVAEDLAHARIVDLSYHEPVNGKFLVQMVYLWLK